jgi:ribonuclease-3
LEFLGDGVLDCIAKYYLYRRFPKANEGFMTEKKIAIVKNENIGRIAMEMGLHKYFVISRYAEGLGIRNNVKKLGCLFEAFIGALFLDFNKIEIKDEDKWFKNVFMVGTGLQMAQVFIENVFERHINWTKLVDENDNYKNILQVKVQKVFKNTPYYIEWGNDEEKGYTIGVYIGFNIKHAGEITYKNIEKIEGEIVFDNILKRMEGKSEKKAFELGQYTHKVKKKAEQNACALILGRIRD